MIASISNTTIDIMDESGFAVGCVPDMPFEVHVGADYDPDEVEFMLAMDRYKRDQDRRFPSWSEALAVLKSLGYRKES